MNIGDIAGAVNAGGLILQFTKQSDENKVQTRLSVLAAVVTRLDTAISLIKSEMTMVGTGLKVDLTNLRASVLEDIRVSRNLLKIVGRSELMPEGIEAEALSVRPVSDQRIYYKPFMMWADSLGKVKNTVTKERMDIEARYLGALGGGMSGVGELSNPTTSNMSLLAWGLLAASAYHGYQKNIEDKRPWLYGLLWAAPTLLFGVKGGLASTGVAVVTGFAKKPGEDKK